MKNNARRLAVFIGLIGSLSGTAVRAEEALPPLYNSAEEFQVGAGARIRDKNSGVVISVSFDGHPEDGKIGETLRYFRVTAEAVLNRAGGGLRVPGFRFTVQPYTRELKQDGNLSLKYGFGNAELRRDIDLGEEAAFHFHLAHGSIEIAPKKGKESLFGSFQVYALGGALLQFRDQLEKSIKQKGFEALRFEGEYGLSMPLSGNKEFRWSAVKGELGMGTDYTLTEADIKFTMATEVSVLKKNKWKLFARAGVVMSAFTVERYEVADPDGSVYGTNRVDRDKLTLDLGFEKRF